MSRHAQEPPLSGRPAAVAAPAQAAQAAPVPAAQAPLAPRNRGGGLLGGGRRGGGLLGGASMGGGLPGSLLGGAMARLLPCAAKRLQGTEAAPTFSAPTRQSRRRQVRSWLWWQP